MEIVDCNNAGILCMRLLVNSALTVYLQDNKVCLEHLSYVKSVSHIINIPHLIGLLAREVLAVGP